MLSTGMLAYGLGSAIKKRRLGKWFSTFFSSRDVIFDVADPLPFLLQWQSILSYIKFGRTQGLSALAVFTFDIEWNGEEMDLQAAAN